MPNKSLTFNPNAMDEENPIVNYWKTRKDMLDKMPVKSAIKLCRAERYGQLIKWKHEGIMTHGEFRKEVDMLYGIDN